MKKKIAAFLQSVFLRKQRSTADLLLECKNLSSRIKNRADAASVSSNKILLDENNYLIQTKENLEEYQYLSQLLVHYNEEKIELRKKLLQVKKNIKTLGVLDSIINFLNR